MQAAEATRDLLKQRSEPDALFCANDHMALAAIDVIIGVVGIFDVHPVIIYRFLSNLVS